MDRNQDGAISRDELLLFFLQGAPRPLASRRGLTAAAASPSGGDVVVPAQVLPALDHAARIAALRRLQQGRRASVCGPRG
jgi:hypothetical protein